MKTSPRAIFLSFCVLMLLVPLQVQAVTMTVEPLTAVVGETINVRVSDFLNVPATPPPYGQLRVDFGDGTPRQVRGNLNTGEHSFATTHIYATSGTYVITGSSVYGTPPLVARQTIVITDPPDSVAAALPRGEVGVPYETRLQSAAGNRGNTYRLLRGALAPGLQLDRTGLIRGTPTKQGRFPFTIQITTARGVTSTQDLTLIVDPGRLVLESSPRQIAVTTGSPASRRVTFRVAYPTTALNETIRSTRGEFLANGRVIGANNSPLTINLATANPTETETLAISPLILQAAQRAGTNTITYRRLFSCANLRQGAAEVAITLQTAAAGTLRITGMRLFFEQNNRPMILVQRNERDLTGVVDIQYNGSGYFQGYWEVDGRTIQHVRRHLFYGKVLTLKTPTVPPLPTFSEGAHRLRFIVSEPADAAEQITFPEAMYHVEAQSAAAITPITLTAPADNSTIDPLETDFSWSTVPQIATHRVEFFEDQAAPPFFTAYVKERRYRLPERIIEQHFPAGATVHWRVSGYNDAEVLLAQSPFFSCMITPEAHTYVPGQIIFVVEDSDTGRAAIDRIAASYPLQISERFALASLGKIMVICATDADVLALIKTIAQQEQSVLAQPNFIFMTMAESDPLRSLQSLHRLLDLDAIHQRTSGKGVVVAVIDTGVDLQHRDLHGRIKGYANFVADSPYRGEIHGTAVAGIIAGTRNDFGIRGLAPDAEIIAGRACEQLAEAVPTGRCTSSSLARAIDAAITARADIVNLSLGTDQHDDLIAALLDHGHRDGLLFIAPVGNDPAVQQPSFPAAHPAVLAVAGFDPVSGTPLPNRTLALTADAAAPARNLFTTTPGDRHNYVDGTSFAAAVISGLAALSPQRHEIGGAPLQFPRFSQSEPWAEQVVSSLGL